MQTVLVMLALITTVTGALAGRAVTQEERAKLVAAMAASGCSGGKMEFDDGKYEVDDAVCADKKQFDPAFKLIGKKLED